MTLRYFQSDKGVLERIRARETAEAYRQSQAPTEDLAARLDAFYSAYPNMDVGVMLSLAQAGMDPSDPVVQEIADANFEQKRRGGFFDKVGDVLGGIKSAAGVPLGFIGKGADAALGEIDESLTPTLKGTLRTGVVALETPLQELQTFIRAGGWAGNKLAQDQGDTSVLNRLRNIVDPTRWDDQAEAFGEAYTNAGSSSGREAIGAMLRGEDVDLGSGFIPAGDIEETVRQRANRLTLDVGKAHFGGPGNLSITPGRVFAATVTEPGTTPFNVLSGVTDAAVAWFGDPAAALGAAAKTSRVGNRLGRAGRALRSGEGLAAAADEFAHIGQFAPVVDRTFQGRAAEGLGDLVDNLTGRLRGGRGTRNSVQPDLVEQWLTKGGQRVVGKMAETSDFYELWQATGKQLPVGMTLRIADATSPQEVMDILKPALGAELRQAPEFNGFRVKRADAQGLRLAQEMPGAFIDPSDLDGAVEGLDRWLRNAKVSPELRNASVEALARNSSRQTMVATMDKIMGDVADDLAERIRPGHVGTRQRAREFTRLFNRDVEKARTYFIDEIAENRKAVGVNVGGTVIEAQSPYLFTEYLNSVIPLPEAREIRRATSTLARLVDNPLFERTAGVLDSAQGAWKKLTLLRGAYTVRVIGEEQVRMAASGLDSMFAHPISAISALVGDEDSIGRFIGTGKVRQADVLGDEFFDGAEAASRELQGALNRGWSGWVDDTIFDREFTTLRPGDDGYERAWAQAIGELHGDPIARRVAAADGNLVDVKDWFYRREGRKFRKQMVESRPELATQAGSDAYIDTIWEGVQYRTRSDPVLMQAVSTGKINDARIGRIGETGRYQFSDELSAHLDTIAGPEAVKGQKVLRSGTHKGEVWDNATGWAFSHLMTKPTNYLSRSQTFRQRYWERIEEMLPYMDDATRSKALAQAEGVVDAKQLKRMRQAAPASNRAVTDLADADTIAKGYALDQTKQLLYDLSNRGQFFDVFRLIFPFGEAWREVLTRWAKIGAENPRVLRRSQQLITGARGAGVFHKDVNGEEVFTYPFSRQISKALIGMPIDMNGRVAGLSLMTEVLPGVGPVMQLPAAALLPETPDWDWAREFISPYGTADYGGGLIEAMLPGYAKNIRQFFEQGDDRLFANTVGATMDYLASTGEYDMSNPDDVRRITADATSMAKKVYLLRGLTQFGAPTAPLPEFLVKDKNGDLDVARVVLQDFYSMQEEDYDSAVGNFLDRYGTDLFLLTQGKSFSIPPKLPTSKDAAEWERAHGDVVKDYSTVWGLFAPVGDTEDFDYQAYVRQFDRGDRVTLTPEQRTSLAQARVGRYIYQQAEAKVSERPTRVERDWLLAVKERIQQEYPGYGEMTAGLPTRASTDQVVAELKRAIADPRLSGTEQAKAAGVYLQARDQALAYAAEVGVKTLEAQAAAPAREWLAIVAKRVTARYPAFQEMFDTVFAREVEA